MKAVRGNKEYTISKAQEKAYQDAGYDILDDMSSWPRRAYAAS